MQRVKFGLTFRVAKYFGATLGIAAMFMFEIVAPAQPTNLAVTVRHAPSLNGNGLIQGSLQQLLGENATLNGGFTMTGDLLVPGTPTLRVNGNPTFAGNIGESSISIGEISRELEFNHRFCAVKVFTNYFAFDVHVHTQPFVSTYKKRW
jgi:hypothetical protein